MVLSILLYGCEIWPVRVPDERVLAALDNDSTRRILHKRRRDCVPTIELQPPTHTYTKEGSAGLATLRDVLRVS